MSTESIIALCVSVIALAVAFWQGYLSKAQLNQAKETKSDTEKLLEEIKQKIVHIEGISDETRRDVKDQITRLVDKQDENFKTLLNTPKENSQNQMMMSLIPELLKTPETLKELIKLSSAVKQ